MSQIKRTVRIVTRQHPSPSGQMAEGGFPFRDWSVEIWCLNAQGEQVPASFIEKVTYKLHPTFENRLRVFKKPPFKLEETGWGGFVMDITLTYVKKSGEHHFKHDLHFSSKEYAIEQNLNINISQRPALARALLETGPVPGFDNSSSVEESKKRFKGEMDLSSRKRAKNLAVDPKQLAEMLQACDEDTLLEVVQLIDDYKTPEAYIHNDLEKGEMHVDLYTLSENLLLKMWTLLGGPDPNRSSSNATAVVGSSAD